MTEIEGRTMAVAGGALLLASLLRLGLSAGVDPPPLPGEPGEAGVLLEESLRLAEEEDRRSRPLAPGERLDPNQVDDVELDRLPGVGPALARAIVRDREERGPFGSLAELDRVPGVGAATLARIGEHLTLPATAAREGSTGVRGGSAGRPGGIPASQVDVNRATAGELVALPGIGPALARRIVDHRSRHGPFRAPEELLAVQGIGPVLLARIRDRVRAGP
jgi:competence protein ComEA